MTRKTNPVLTSRHTKTSASISGCGPATIHPSTTIGIHIKPARTWEKSPFEILHQPATTAPARPIVFHLPTTLTALDTWKHSPHHLRPTPPQLRPNPDKQPDAVTHRTAPALTRWPTASIHHPHTTAPPQAA